MKDPGKVVIIGAGPTGLGIAYRLHELGFEDFVVLDARDLPGGLASSYVDSNGFTWDIGGHVQFSHYEYYDRVLDRALGDAWLEHERESWIWIRNRFVPYPFQNNIHRLDADDCSLALRGLEAAAACERAGASENFREWIFRTFGEGIAELFLVPYNLKVWGYPLEQIGTGWMGERVAVPNVERIKRNVAESRDDVSWGPNSTFRFPLHGGTGAIWRAVGALIPAARLRRSAVVQRVDSESREVCLLNSGRERYDVLVNTMPLPSLTKITNGLDTETVSASQQLLSSSSHILGIGCRGGMPETLSRKCWMYFPEANSPYYRVTVFSNYSPNNVPRGDGHWSLMAEVSETSCKPVDASSLREWTLAALRQDRLLGDKTDVVSFWHHFEPFGYPTPSVDRDEILRRVQPVLESKRIFSRGRFGGWRYEVSNQDHSFMQGVELAGRLTGTGEEVTINDPDYVNSGALASEGRNRRRSRT